MLSEPELSRKDPDRFQKYPNRNKIFNPENTKPE